jgi:hypothetical protein
MHSHSKFINTIAISDGSCVGFYVHCCDWHTLQLLQLSLAVEPETLPQQLLRQVDEATTLTWRQVIVGSLL